MTALNYPLSLSYSRVMDGSATIKSAHDGTTLELFDRSNGYYRARLAGPNFQGTGTVYEYELDYLKAFFVGLAADWKGCSGKRAWSSLEGELSLSATIDSTGHVSVSVQMRSGPYPLDWRLSAVLLVEAGQLDRIADSISAFVDHSAAE